MALLAAYSFDEASGAILDASGNGRSWTLNNGAVRHASGHTNTGLSKLGAGFAVVAEPAFGQTTARTFMFWCQGAGNAVWWLRWHTTGADTGTWGIYNLGGNVTLRMRKGGGNTNITTPFPADGLYHHYAGTYDGSVSRLYLDGVLVATSGTLTAPLDTADRIDCLETSLTTQVIDDLRIYDEALTQSQIATLMATPVSAATDITGTATGAGGGTGAATGVRETAGTATGVGGGSGAATGVGERTGTATGSAGGTGAATGTRETTGTGAGAAGGSGSATGVREFLGLATGTGGGAGAATSVRETLGAAVGSGGGIGRALVPGESTTPPERTFVIPAETRILTVPFESRVMEVT